LKTGYFNTLNMAPVLLRGENMEQFRKK